MEEQQTNVSKPTSSLSTYLLIIFSLFSLFLPIYYILHYYSLTFSGATTSFLIFCFSLIFTIGDGMYLKYESKNNKYLHAVFTVLFVCNLIFLFLLLAFFGLKNSFQGGL